jgi:hypothetical protein
MNQNESLEMVGVGWWCRWGSGGVGGGGNAWVDAPTLVSIAGSSGLVRASDSSVACPRSWKLTW